MIYIIGGRLTNASRCYDGYGVDAGRQGQSPSDSRPGHSGPQRFEVKPGQSRTVRVGGHDKLYIKKCDVVVVGYF